MPNAGFLHHRCVFPRAGAPAQKDTTSKMPHTVLAADFRSEGHRCPASLQVGEGASGLGQHRGGL